MKKRSKTYRPKYVSVNPLSTFFGGLSGDHAEHLQVLLTKNAAAMAAMVTGRGDKEFFDRLTGAINMANVLCEQGIGNEFREATIAGRDAMLSMGKRALRTGRFAFTGDELAVMNEAMECHTAQLTNIRSIDVDRAADEVQRRIRHRINSTSVRSELEKEAA